jgi:hypothetical protein
MRIETLRAFAPLALGVFRHERVEKPRSRLEILDDADAPEGDHARVRNARVAFEAAVGKHLARFVDFEANARLVIDVGAQVPFGASVVNQDVSLLQDVEKRDAVRPAVLAHRREPAAESLLEHLTGAHLRHQLVSAPHLGQAAHRDPPPIVRRPD